VTPVVALLGDAYTEEGAVREDLGTSILSGFRTAKIAADAIRGLAQQFTR
jgi:hypothetical protein